MKKIKTIIALTSLLGVFAACKKDKLLTYDGSANSIYYAYTDQSNNKMDTTAFTFGFTPVAVTDSILKIPVLVTGQASSKDRVYNVLMDTGTTAVAGKHYRLPSTFIFHANRLRDSLPVTLLRSADLQTKAVTLRLTLKPSADLQTNLKTLMTNVGDTLKLTTFKLNISDMLVAGQYWAGSFQPYFGTFSVKKVQLINQVTGMPLNYITIVGLYDLNFSSRMVYYAINMANYLAAQKAAGHTVYEADGVTPMTMGAAYQ
jgi:hypothetical protein